jgi:putative flippase GtrA
MMDGATTNSCWDRQLEEIRRCVNERQFWQDIAPTQVKGDASAENATNNCNASRENSANPHADNAARAMASCGEKSKSEKTLPWNSLRRFRGDESAHETENALPQAEIQKKSIAVGTFVRWWRFNFVGGIGIVVQFGALFFLKSVLHLHYLAATALAVEIAVLHNFLWHERFTWADRFTRPAQKDTPQTSGAEALTKKNGFVAALKRCATQNHRRPILARLARFHMGNGAVSILGGLALMKVMVGRGHMNYLAANAIAIAVCSLANFLVSDQWVFER